MRLSNDIRHGRHCVFALHVHLVFVTKYRRNVFDGDALQRLKTVFEKVCADFEAQRVEMNGAAEHVHLLINYPPKHSVSSLVNTLKVFPVGCFELSDLTIEKRYWKDALWSPSYFAATCGGAPLGISDVSRPLLAPKSFHKGLRSVTSGGPSPRMVP